MIRIWLIAILVIGHLPSCTLISPRVPDGTATGEPIIGKVAPASGLQMRLPIKTEIVSNPPGCSVFAGDAPDNLRDTGRVTPCNFTSDAAHGWSNRFFQVKKTGFADSMIKDLGSAPKNRFAHFDLKVAESRPSEKASLSESDLRTYLSDNPSTLDPIEGIWASSYSLRNKSGSDFGPELTGPKVAIVRDQGRKDADFIQVVLWAPAQMTFVAPFDISGTFSRTSRQGIYLSSQFRPNGPPLLLEGYLQSQGVLRMISDGSDFSGPGWGESLTFRKIFPPDVAALDATGGGRPVPPQPRMIHQPVRITPASPASAKQGSPSRITVPPSSTCETGHWIKSVSPDGAIVVLDDSSVWSIDAVDSITTSLWLPISDVIVCSFRLINVDDGESVSAHRLQ